jgi:hypothetical protein
LTHDLTACSPAYAGTNSRVEATSMDHDPRSDPLFDKQLDMIPVIIRQRAPRKPLYHYFFVVSSSVFLIYGVVKLIFAVFGALFP